MIKHKTYAVKIIVFAIIISFLICEVNYILSPKKYFDNTWPTTSTYKGFYQMKKNSVDVLFLGSSHAASSFNPQKIYNEHGIRSYNLGCEQQNILVSYYWLREALRYQSPKLVVLDAYMLFGHKAFEPLNTEEPCTRMAMDAMRWSRVKWEAVKAICENDESQTFNSYLFKNVRFHSRWTNLTENDFLFHSLEKHYELKGYTPLGSREEEVNADYEPYDEFDTEAYDDMVPLMKEYLDQMVSLCREKGIELILTKTPTKLWRTSKHNTVRKYAEDNGIEFWDLNEKELYEACGFEFTKDMNDEGHSNIWGSEKISGYLADRFYNDYGIGGGDYSEQWSDTAGYYDQVYADCVLPYITDINMYLDAINQGRYTILISVKNNVSNFMTEELTAKFRELGLQFDIGEYKSYYAAISGGVIKERNSTDTISFRGSTCDKHADYAITSSNWHSGEISSILINNVEYSYNHSGLNIVIYSNDRKQVVDRCWYNGEICRE